MGTTPSIPSTPTPSGPPIFLPTPGMELSPYISNFPCDDVIAITRRSEPITVKLSCYDIVDPDESQSPTLGNNRTILQGGGNNDSDNVSLESQPLNGFIEFTVPTLTYYPYKDWPGYDEVKLLYGDIQLLIIFANVDFYACKGDRLPKPQYSIVPGEPSIFEGVECVKPIHIPTKGPDKNASDAREECEQVGGHYNLATDECQMEDIIDPFFRKNYLSFGKAKNKKI